MKDIRIPFRAMFKEPLIMGVKTSTLRTKQYGKVGDVFEAFGYRFELIAICPTTVRLGINYLYKQEGFEQPGLLWKVWGEIHPTLSPEAVVFAHFFKRVAI